MKTVNVYIKVSQKSKDLGYGYMLLEYGGRTREVYINQTNQTTPNRSAFFMVIQAMETLKEPCEINFYIRAEIGYKFMHRPKKNWVNRDMGDKTLAAAEEKGHVFHFVSGNYFSDKDKEVLSYLDKRIELAIADRI